MDKQQLQQCLDLALSAVKAADEVVMQVYGTDFSVQHKDDKSPVTLADQQSHEAICAVLANSPWPIVSEESAELPAKNCRCFWLVDPLDGTKEFIRKNGEFTVNIALVENERPVLGVVSIPASQQIYYAMAGCGAFKIEGNVRRAIHCSSLADISRATLAVSRSHLRPDDEAFIERAGITDVKPLGSALKYCQLAEGLVDISVRYTPLMQWDLAASDVIVHEAGGKVRTFQGESYQYDINASNKALSQGLNVMNGVVDCRRYL